MNGARSGGMESVVRKGAAVIFIVISKCCQGRGIKKQGFKCNTVCMIHCPDIEMHPDTDTDHTLFIITLANYFFESIKPVN